jgi:hypothetical protein
VDTRPRQQTLVAHDPAQTHQGWIATDGGAWLPCCSGDYGACWDALLRVETRGRCVERVVLPTGQMPGKAKR